MMKCLLTLGLLIPFAANCPVAFGEDNSSSRETITIIAPHFRPPGDWEKMQVHQKDYERLEAEFDHRPPPRLLSVNGPPASITESYRDRQESLSPTLRDSTVIRELKTSN